MQKICSGLIYTKVELGIKRKGKKKKNKEKWKGVYSCVLGQQEPLHVLSEKEAQEYDLYKYWGPHINASHSQNDNEG